MRCYFVAVVLIGAVCMGVSIGRMSGVALADDLPPAKDKESPEQLEEKASYALGFRMGFVHRSQSISINVEALLKGFRDALAGKEPAFSEQELSNALTEHRKAARTQLAKKNKQDGEAFLKANKKKEDVKELDSGLQYIVLKQGDGPSPGPTDRVRAHYEGTFVDGTVFDTTLKTGEPATFPLNEVIDGWQEALQLMKVGDKWRLFVPSELGYGPNGYPPNAGPDDVLIIGPNAVLIFEVELIAIEP